MNGMLIVRVSSNVAALLLVGGVSVYAQTPGMVCGTATDSAGAVLAGVTVTLAHDAETPATTTTDSTGNYLFPKVSIGKYTLSFTLEGFKKSVRPGLIITSGFELRIDQHLEPSLMQSDAQSPQNPPFAPVGSDPPRRQVTFTKTIVATTIVKNPDPPPAHPCGAPR
jgi:hypothetical protein